MTELIDTLNRVAKECSEEECSHISDDLKLVSNSHPNFKEILLIADALSIFLFSENSHQPYASIIDNFNESDLDIFDEIYEKINSFEVKSRLADILWIKRKKPQYAYNAIQSYLEQARISEDFEHWVSTANRIERALKISSLFKRSDISYFNDVIKYIENLLEKIDGNDPLYLSLKLMQFLLDYRQGDSHRYYSLSKKIANKALTAKQYNKAQEHYKQCTSWAKLVADSQLIDQSYEELCESYVVQAIDTSEESALKAAHWMKLAVETHKNIAGKKDRKDYLYKLLREYQTKSLDELKPFEIPIDVSAQIPTTLSILNGKNLFDSLFALAYQIIEPPNYKKIEEQAKEFIKNTPLLHIMGGKHIDSEGKIVANTPSSMSSDETAGSKVIWSASIRLVGFEHLYIVKGVIEPAREYICQNLYVTEADFYNLCTNNPFIKEGQEYLYAKGLYSGLIGELIVSAQFLVPLLENSLRHVLSEFGVIVSSLNNYGVQEEIRLNSILDNPKTTEIFGEDLINDLKMLLIERRYGNLRNNIAHGLATINHYYTYQVIYLWWIILRLCLFCKVKLEN